jgi:hypothetical protein
VGQQGVVAGADALGAAHLGRVAERGGRGAGSERFGARERSIGRVCSTLRAFVQTCVNARVSGVAAAPLRNTTARGPACNTPNTPRY